MLQLAYAGDQEGGEAGVNSEPAAGRARLRSELPFPYAFLEDAEALARKMTEAGGVPFTRDQLAGLHGTDANSSSFVGRLSSAVLFGLVVKNDRQYTLTRLGDRISSSHDQEARAARVEAFQTPELYRRLLEHFKGKTIPSREAVANYIEHCGVSPRQKERARQVFDRSAQYAGFRDVAKDRLIVPIISTPAGYIEAPTRAEPAEAPAQTPAVSEAVVTSDPSNEKLVRGMLDLLPPVGTPWGASERVRWLRRFSTMLAALYDPDDDTEISVRVVKSED